MKCHPNWGRIAFWKEQGTQGVEYKVIQQVFIKYFLWVRNTKTKIKPSLMFYWWGVGKHKNGENEKSVRLDRSLITFAYNFSRLKAIEAKLQGVLGMKENKSKPLVHPSDDKRRLWRGCGICKQIFLGGVSPPSFPLSWPKGRKSQCKYVWGRDLKYCFVHVILLLIFGLNSFII